VTVDATDRRRAQVAFCGWLFVIALAARLAFVLFYEQFPPLLGDDVAYDAVAQHLVAGRGFAIERASPAGIVLEPQVRVGPAYPLFLAAIYSVFGHSVLGVRIAQAVVGALTAVLTARIGSLAFGRQVGRLAGGITAVLPGLIVYTGMLLTEVAFAFLLVLSVWLASEALYRSSGGSWWIATGVALGVASLLRAEAIVVAPLVAAAVFFGTRARRLGPALLLCLATGLTVGAWTLRNYIHYRELVLVSTHGGPTLWIATMGWSDWRFDDPAYQELLTPGANDVEQARVFQRQGFKNILNDPLGYLQLCVRRFFELWLGSHTTYVVGFTEGFRVYYAAGAMDKLAVKLTLLAANTALIGLAFLAMPRAFRASAVERRPHVWLCTAPIVAVAIVHFFLYSGARYHVPVLPFVAILGAAALRQAASGTGFYTVNASWRANGR
jgi:4-amino-4-deoxy-L-arabinose transferase-like glycosyltransferase